MSDENNRNPASGLKPPSGEGNIPIGLNELVRGAIHAKLEAIAGYDSILWKIRSGYLAVLYGALALIFGTSGIHIQTLVKDPALLAAAFFLISGFSVSAFMVDFGYLRKKLKVIAARDELVRLTLDADLKRNEKLLFLLRITGEARVPPSDLFDCAHREYSRQRNWNLFWITLWLYFTAPAIAASIWLKAS